MKEEREQGPASSVSIELSTGPGTKRVLRTCMAEWGIKFLDSPQRIAEHPSPDSSPTNAPLTPESSGTSKDLSLVAAGAGETEMGPLWPVPNSSLPRTGWGF